MLKCSQIWPDTWFKFFIGTLSTAISQVPSNCLCVANIFVLAYILFYIIIYLYKIYKNYRHKQRTAEAQKKGQLILMSSDSFMTREGERKGGRWNDTVCRGPTALQWQVGWWQPQSHPWSNQNKSLQNLVSYSLSIFLPATLTTFLLLKHTKSTLTSGPLHMSHWLRMLFLQIATWLFPLPPSFLYSTIVFLVRSFLVIASTVSNT